MALLSILLWATLSSQVVMYYASDLTSSDHACRVNHQAIKDLREALKAEITADLRAEMTQMKQVTTEQNDTITALQRQVAALTPTPTHEEYVVYGCYGDTLSLNCSGDTVIQVNTANYGNFFNCGDACCIPDPGQDCQESVETSSPQDWEALLLKCNNQTSCDVINAGGLLQSCNPMNVDYLTIRYYCETVAVVVGAVGFTAYSTRDRISVVPNQKLIFDGVVSNFGGAYDNTTGEFTCPVTGVYMFTATVINGDNGQSTMWAEIFKSGLLLGLHADLQSGVPNSSSATVFTTCDQGERVYVRTDASDRSHWLWGSETQRYSSFSGYLMSI